MTSSKSWNLRDPQSVNPGSYVVGKVMKTHLSSLILALKHIRFSEQLGRRPNNEPLLGLILCNYLDRELC